jgi:protein ImuB
MLWIAVTLPWLPLEALKPPLPEADVIPAPGARPPQVQAAGCAVADAARIILADPAAQASGIYAGMSRTHALALEPALLLLNADAARVEAVLAELALALLIYTPRVVLAQAHTVLLEVGNGLRLFGGLRALLRQVAHSAALYGSQAAIACAPSAWGAWLLAHAQVQGLPGVGTRVLRPETLARQLDRLPIELLPAAAAHGHALQQIGCATLGALRALPSAGVSRRFGAGVLTCLAQAYGTAADPRTAFCAPLRFAARLELHARIEHSAALLNAAARLLAQLAGWLTARHAALNAYTLVLVHDRARGGGAVVSHLPVSWAEPSRDPAHLIWLLREKLNQTQLAAPVLELRLQADHVEVYAPPPQTLFALPGSELASAQRLFERLTARLGAAQVRQLELHEDHRPEAAMRTSPCQPAPSARAPARHGGPARGHASASPPQPAGHGTAAGAVVLPQHAARPAWLLETPLALQVRQGVPCYRGPLHVISGPERIETGWWDEGAAARDYFVARDGTARLCWIYREHSGGAWFLQGWFG